MIIQFPTPYPDELLYSIIARYHIRSGNVFWKHTLEDLFGKRTISASVFLPSGIASLVQHLPKNTTLNEQMLIEKHTMYPFYTVFLPTEKAQSIYESMTSDDGKKIYMQSGIMASSIPQNRYLKYCSACAEEDIATYRELYWHRLHQLPGNLICAKHELWLEDSDVLITHSNKHAFILPTTSNCDLKRKRKITENNLIHLKDIVLRAEHLLNRKYQNQCFSHFTKFYRYHLMEKGYASYRGQVYQKKLYDDFHTYFSQQVLENLHVKIRQSDSWIANISRKHRKSFHPYYHILMLTFLGLDTNSIFKGNSFESYPFGKPKWPCLNVVCPKYHKKVIDEVTVRICEKTKKPIGRFTCPVCGFSYTRKGQDPEKTGQYRYTRIMDFGPIWNKVLKTLLEEKLSYREIARRLNVDPGTVIKYKSEKEGIEKSTKEVLKQDESGTIERYRQVWMQLQGENPRLSKTQLRNINPATYAYLYRNDNEWLQNNSPNLKKRRNDNKRVDWQKRDQEILASVQKSMDEIRYYNDKPKRVTVKRIGDVIGERALLEQHLDKMPKTKALVDDVCESEKDFRVRRIGYVIGLMNNDEDEIKVWKVLRNAGINKKFYEEVSEYIRQITNFSI
ncbi:MULTISPECIES: TnsD family Tn7-like transposition protein [Bacillaceae]|jgi:transposase-like protein|uniref:TnsD family transposase n=1 Tax=Cytobacillus stercorigallinarum TaxID=2762240 RepID=A0ABR8QPX8_9BACI|nr:MULTISPECIES: TnsD family Tn7-like transposition protein [Bacillaceae]MBD7937593.1 TnsD family transposase [Cytobacillus stercorigallinarum]MCM3363009.1 TnsD family transposase [Niallia sp. MER TA 168]MCM3443708.1 TnsD family transposase [Metabacillus halosaccharovorans]